MDWHGFWLSKNASRKLGNSVTAEEIQNLLQVNEHLLYDDAERLSPEWAQELFDVAVLHLDEPNAIMMRSQAPVPPGAVIKLALEKRKIRQVECAKVLQIKPSFLSEMINGKRPVTVETALLLERAFDVPAHVFMRLQADWELYAQRQSLLVQKKNKHDEELKQRLQKANEILTKIIEEIEPFFERGQAQINSLLGGTKPIPKDNPRHI